MGIQREGLGRGQAGKDADKKPCNPAEADGRAGDTILLFLFQAINTT
jgi:hypothetical protein